MSPRDLESRILLLLDGSISDEEFSALHAELLADPRARAVYRQWAHLHSALETLHKSRTAAGQVAPVPMDRIIRLQRHHIVKVSLLAAAAILVVSAVSMWLVMVPHPPVSIATFQTAPGSIFTLTHQGDGDVPEGTVLTEGSRLRLLSGTMEGVFETGVRMVIEAPCDLSVLKEDRVALKEGVAWFQVPAHAAGFAVETPELVIVDLGTEFGVVASGAGHDEIHVTMGSVEVTPNHQGGKKQTLHADQARRVDQVGHLHEIPPDATRFRTALLQTRSIAIANPSFESDVIPRDGNTATNASGTDDFNDDIVPKNWTGFDDGRGDTDGTGTWRQGIISTAPDSFINASLAATPDADANDQAYFTAARDIYQVLSATLQADTTYTITVDIGDRNFKGIAGHPGTPIINFGTGTVPGTSILTPTTTHVPTQINGDWVTWSFTYATGSNPAGLGEPLRIELTTGENVGWFDHVRLSATGYSR